MTAIKSYSDRDLGPGHAQLGVPRDDCDVVAEVAELARDNLRDSMVALNHSVSEATAAIDSVRGAIELLETKLREATDIVKRLSNALKEMTKGQAVNDRMKQHNQVTPSKKTNVESKIQSSPSLFSPSYVKKPAVKIIIDGEGKAEFLNKNGELVDGTSGTPVSKTITKEVETAKITTSDEVKEGDDQKITNNEDNDVKKVAEVVAENGNKSNMPASNNDKETNDGWK